MAAQATPSRIGQRPGGDARKRAQMGLIIASSAGLSRPAVLRRIATELGYKNTTAAAVMAHRWQLNKLLPGAREGV